MSQTNEISPVLELKPQSPAQTSTQPLEKSTFLSHSLNTVTEWMRESVRDASYWKKVTRHIDPHDNCFPAPGSVLASAACFFGFCIFGGFAIGFPTHWMEVAISAYAVLSFVALVMLKGAAQSVHTPNQCTPPNTYSRYLISAITHSIFN
jgi:hypothetical protein